MTPAGLAQLKQDEGCRLQAYPDQITHAAPWTVGYGCTGHDADGNAITPKTVWTQAKADSELLRRVAGFERDLASAIPWIHTLNDVRRDVLTNMAFNLGIQGLLGFPNTLAAIKANHFDQASDMMLQSKWAKQVKGRAGRLAEHMRTGQ